MAIKENVKDVKVVLKFKKGTQTMSSCDLAATPKQLYDLSTAVETLVQDTVVDRLKITQISLFEE